MSAFETNTTDNPFFAKPLSESDPALYSAISEELVELRGKKG